jgi:hypothetical protein
VLRLAERLTAIDAVLALAAGITEPRNRHPLANRPGGNPGAQLLDDSDAFVTGNEREARLDRSVPVGGMDVRVAQTARLHPHQNLARGRLGNGPFLNGERLTKA